MDMKNISSGELRAIGYDAGSRLLRVRLASGVLLEYSGVGHELWLRLSSASSPWSVYRDCIEEDFDARRVSASRGDVAAPRKNPLDDLFG